MANPDWCDWVPLSSQQHVSECDGYTYPSMNRSSCANWCQWIAGPSWGSTSDCMECYSFYSEHYEKQKHRSKEAQIAATALQKKACPPYCRWLTRSLWGRYPSCASCEDSVPLIIIPLAFQGFQGFQGSEKQNSSGLKLKKLHEQRPDWCKWVPISSLQHVGECTTETDTTVEGGCKVWCNWSPFRTWQYLPECRQCNKTLPEAETRLVKLGNVQAPGNGCEDWCRWVSRPAWLESPDCSSCDRDANLTDMKKLP
eukprot:Skav220909  [mRNA]  locus=scaffold1585:56957:59317:- [translate_table: standard]